MGNSDSLVTLISLIVFITVFFVLAIKSRAKVDSIEIYAVGNKSFSTIFVSLSLAASLTSAATFIINPGFISLYGLSAYLAFGVVMPISIFFALIIFIKKFRKYGVNVKSISIADWLGKRYDSQFLKVFFGFLSILLITFIVLICVGITKVVSKALNVEELYVLITLVIIVFTYMSIGGANSMVYTNSIQAILMVIVAILLIGSGAEYMFQAQGTGLFERLNHIDPMLTKPFNSESPLFRDFFEVVVCNAIVGIAIVCQPHILTKSLLIKKDEQVNKFLFYTIIILILFFSVVFAGFYARLMFPELTMNGEVLKMDGLMPAYVVQRFPIYVGILVILGLFAAGLSTLEGLIQSIPTTITNDFLLPILKGLGISNTNAISVNKMLIVVVAIASIILSYQQLVSPSLSVGIFAQNGVYAFFSAAFVPVFFGIFTKTQNKTIPIIASIVAVITHFSVYYLELTPYMKGMAVKNPAVASALALIISTIIAMIVYVTNPMKNEVAK
ncbi:sodium:solute symporter family transporter [Aegicerativicinus sediminis]|uniref:sodium:solute symporter family transporter n=1 Tax=Aegicerativicinus sediminis TaxID=2893202 RepID=UPI001E2DE907|nr:sodium:solute symporter [Aegicerativicinus sediminis]